MVESCYAGQVMPFKHGRPGKRWYSSFMKRHPILVEKKSEYLSKARSAVTEDRIRNWFQDVRDLLGDAVEILNHPSKVYNLDETCFFLNSNHHIVLAERGRPVHEISDNTDKDNITVSFCVNAEGENAPPLVIYKYKRMPQHFLAALPDGWSIRGTENGWMDSETFFEYFANVFIPHVIQDVPVVVFFDGHKSHLSMQVSDLAKEHNIHLVCLPPSTTHILQPLDVSFFKPLKTRFKQEKSIFELEKKRNMFKYELPQLLQSILDKYNFKEATKNGFRKCGIFPFEENAVDYSACLKSSVSDEAPGVVGVKGETVLDYLESKIGNSIMQEFHLSRNNQWKGDLRLEALFDVWQKFLADDASFCVIDKSTHIVNLPVCISNNQGEVHEVSLQLP